MLGYGSPGDFTRVGHICRKADKSPSIVIQRPEARLSYCTPSVSRSHAFE